MQIRADCLEPDGLQDDLTADKTPDYSIAILSDLDNLHAACGHKLTYIDCPVC